MIEKLSAVVFFSLAAVAAGCGGQGSSGTTGGAAGDKPASCDAVVKVLMDANKGSGDPEKKLFTKMCADLTPAERSCIVNAKTTTDRDACLKDKKLVK